MTEINSACIKPSFQVNLTKALKFIFFPQIKKKERKKYFVLGSFKYFFNVTFLTIKFINPQISISIIWKILFPLKHYDFFSIARYL